jgi:hypothetical protein
VGLGDVYYIHNEGTTGNLLVCEPGSDMVRRLWTVRGTL